MSLLGETVQFGWIREDMRTYDGEARYAPVRRDEEDEADEYVVPVDVNVSKKGRLAGAGFLLVALAALAGESSKRHLCGRAC
jgi:hypothetical protein